jgi:type I restriction enzyme S subunit
MKFISDEFHARLKKSALAPGDVVIVRTGKPGACVVIPEWLPVANCSDVVIVRCGHSLNPYFLAYYVNAIAQDHVSAHLVGAVQQHFNVGAARKIKIPLPPIQEQRQIAAVLRAFDQRIDILEDQSKALESIARAIFKSWFVNFDPVRAKAEGREPEGMDAATAALFPSEFQNSDLGPVPSGWSLSAIRDMTSNIQYGLTTSAQADIIGPKFLRITDIQGSRVDWRKVPYCVASQAEKNRYQIKPHDIVVARTGASTGENIYLPTAPDAVFASYLVRLQFENWTHARLVGAFMRSTAYFEYVQNAIGGSAQPNASAQILAGAKLIVPSSALCERYARIVAPMDRKLWHNATQSNSLSTLRDTLLPRLITGKLRVPEAEKLMEAML